MLSGDQIEDWKKRWEEFPDEGHGLPETDKSARTFAVNTLAVQTTEDAIAFFYRNHPTGIIEEVTYEPERTTWTIKWRPQL